MSIDMIQTFLRHMIGMSVWPLNLGNWRNWIKFGDTAFELIPINAIEIETFKVAISAPVVFFKLIHICETSLTEYIYAKQCPMG